MVTKAPNVVVIVQARMTSTRLKGKVLIKVQGKSLLEHELLRLKKLNNVQEIVVATTTNEIDTPIVNLCESMVIPYYRGSEQDVLGRYYETATQFAADIIVRVTSDCPLIDPAVTDQVIDKYLQSKGNYDYVSNCLERTYPRGFDTEVFSYEALKQAWQEAICPTEREHVTTFIRSQPGRFRLGNVISEIDYSHYRWTVDTPEDMQLISEIYSELYKEGKFFDYKDILDLLKRRPELALLNKHIEQKKC